MSKSPVDIHIKEGERSQKCLVEQVRACPRKMQRGFVEHKELECLCQLQEVVPTHWRNPELGK